LVLEACKRSWISDATQGETTRVRNFVTILVESANDESCSWNRRDRVIKATDGKVRYHSAIFSVAKPIVQNKSLRSEAVRATD
jgi:hypothetical protein